MFYIKKCEIYGNYLNLWKLLGKDDDLVRDSINIQMSNALQFFSVAKEERHHAQISHSLRFGGPVRQPNSRK
jgi:hypothetical protein